MLDLSLERYYVWMISNFWNVCFDVEIWYNLTTLEYEMPFKINQPFLFKNFIDEYWIMCKVLELSQVKNGP